jgi:hypothetical protein
MREMKETIVGGLVAGLVAGSMMAGAVVLTRDGAGTPAQGGPVEVHGEVTIGNGCTVYSGCGDNPVLVKIDQPIGSQAPDGSSDNPFYIRQSGALYVKSCDGASNLGPGVTVCK